MDKKKLLVGGAIGAGLIAAIVFASKGSAANTVEPPVAENDLIQVNLINPPAGNEQTWQAFLTDMNHSYAGNMNIFTTLPAFLNVAPGVWRSEDLTRGAQIEKPFVFPSDLDVIVFAPSGSGVFQLKQILAVIPGPGIFNLDYITGELTKIG